jgi:N-acetylmuramoyl-L-alanine amidase
VCPGNVDAETAFARAGDDINIDGAAGAVRMSPGSGGGARRGVRRIGVPRASAVVLGIALVAAVVAFAAGLEEDGPKTIDFDFPPHGVIRWERGGNPFLLAMPLQGDGWISMARRYAGDAGAAASLRAANPALRAPIRGRAVRVPVAVLYDDLRLSVVQRLFPVDQRVAGGWQHWVLAPFDRGEEGWRWLAEVFSGDPDLAAALAGANRAAPDAPPKRGLPVIIPEAHLARVFRDLPVVAAPTPPAPPASLVERSGPPPLEYGRDARGEYAVYRLREGEALYSAVVVRFTGQLLAKQVNETAMEIAARSQIDDVTEIPIGYPVKIPLELLLPEYLPEDHPQRQAWLAEQRELGRFFDRVSAADLAGVQVVLDAGHGGKDSGATVDGLWETTYAYDIMCRIKANLERHTRATVWTTIEYPDIGCSIPAVDRLPQSRNARLLTRPRYDLSDSVLGVHLRWYLTNDIILNRLGPEVPRKKTVFLSVHADSLHPSVRGAMVYVPSRYLRPEEPYTVKRRDIQKYAEYRNHPTVRLGADFKARVEASSRYLANNIIGSLEDNDIAVHPYEPVRDRVLRGRRAWVPAVLRYTAAQNAVLVEVCNMANASDRANLQRASWREQFARAVVEGMASAFED